MDNFTNISTGLRAFNFLMAIMMMSNNGFSSDFNQQWNDGNVELRPSTIVHRIVYAGAPDLLNSNNSRLDGISDFQAQQLDPATNIIATGIKLGYAAATTSTSAGAVLYDNDRENLPAAVVNGRLELWQAGKKIFSMSAGRLMSQVTSDTQSGDIFKLPAFVLLRGGITTEIKFVTPSGSTITPPSGNSAYFSIEIEGLVTGRKSI